jgi:hypothetical protein
MLLLGLSLLKNTGAGLAPTYYPGTANFAEARPVIVKLGETVNNVDFTVVSVNNASIRGVVDAASVANAQVSASQIGPGLLYGYGARLQPDGTFTFLNLTPGDYEVRATGVSTTPDRSPLVSVERIALTDGEVRELRPTLTRMTTGSGQVIVDSASTSTLSGAPPVFQIVPEPRTNPILYQARPANSLTTVRVQPDLRFTFSVQPGRAVITPYTLPSGWYMKAIKLNGVDVSDGVDFPVGGTADGIEIELTNRPSAITGTARIANGQLADDYTVLVFSQDPTRRRGVTRYFATARPDASGTFSAYGLPSGEYYAIAVDWADPDVSADPDSLEPLAKDATAFTVVDGEPKALELRLIP